MTRFLPLLFIALSLRAQDCVQFIDNTNYCRPATRWFVTPDTNDYPLYLNGVFQNSTDPGGPASIDALNWPSKYPVLVGIADDAHGIALDNIITNICPGAMLFHASGDANGIRSCISNGCQVINLSWNTDIQGETTTDFSNACWQASQGNIIVCCSVPNSNISIDGSTPSYPASWNLPLSIPVTSSTRLDAVFNPSATGTNVIAAPGRVIVCQSPDGTPAYGSGTSYAAPMAAGVSAWLLGQFQQTPQVIVQALRNGSVAIDSRIQGRLSMNGAVNALRPILNVENGVPVVNGIGQYGFEYSPDLTNWSEIEITNGTRFLRAKIL